MSSDTPKLEELRAVSRLLIAAVSNRCTQTLSIPEVVAAATDPPQLLAWVRLLNLAATPAALRLTLQGSTDSAPAVAMLRFLARGGPEMEHDRDKIDLLATWLAAKWHPKPTSEEGQIELLANLKACLASHGEPELPAAASESIRKLRELGTRATSAASLHQLVSSGTYREARSVKQEAGQYFSHPRVLAAAATWNLVFAGALERLFLQGVVQMGNVDAGTMLAGAEFLMASGQREGADLILGLAGAPAVRTASAVTSAPKPLDQQSGGPAVAKAEASNIRDMQLTIHNHVATAPGDDHHHIIPLPDFELVLSPAEWEAFHAAYFEEQSFRGECARAFALLVSVYGRLSVVLASYRRKEHSSHLWHQDANALSHLVPIADKALESVTTVVEISEARGLTAKLAALRDTCEKLKTARQEAEHELEKRHMSMVADAAPVLDRTGSSNSGAPSLAELES